MAAHARVGAAVSTEEIRRELEARLRIRKRNSALAFLAVVALVLGFIVVRLWTSPEWWAYNTVCGLAMILGTGVVLWWWYGRRRAALRVELSQELFRGK